MVFKLKTFANIVPVAILFTAIFNSKQNISKNSQKTEKNPNLRKSLFRELCRYDNMGKLG